MWTQFMTKKIKISYENTSLFRSDTDLKNALWCTVHFLCTFERQLLATFTFLFLLKSFFDKSLTKQQGPFYQSVHKESKIFSGHFVYLFKDLTLRWKKTRMLVIFKWWGLRLMRLQRLLLLQEKKNRSLILSHNHVKKSPRMISQIR